MPERNELTLTDGEVVITLAPDDFVWPATPVRAFVHETSGGSIVEVDPVLRIEDVVLELHGTERTGWAGMDEATRAEVEAIYQSASPFSLEDWLGHSGTFMFEEPPVFKRIADDGTTAYFTWDFKLAQVGGGE